MKIQITIEVPGDSPAEVRISPEKPTAAAGDGVIRGGTYAQAWRQLYAAAREAGITPGETPPVGETSGTKPGTDPRPSAAGDRELARAMLADAGEQNPEALLRTFSPERIIEVCTMAAEKADKIRNIPGYINAALRKGWTK